MTCLDSSHTDLNCNTTEKIPALCGPNNCTKTNTPPSGQQENYKLRALQGTRLKLNDIQNIKVSTKNVRTMSALPSGESRKRDARKLAK